MDKDIHHQPGELPPAQSIHLALVENAALVREGLAALFAQTPDITCTVVAADHESALEHPKVAAVDVALLDVSIGDLLSSGTLRLWQEVLPQARIILFDEFVRDMHLRYVLRSQLAGYATKRDSFSDLLHVIRSAMLGEQAFSATPRQRLCSTSQGWQIHSSHGAAGLHSLTPRETEVLSHLAQGLSGRQCSEILGISQSTVENHKSRIMRKLKVHKVTELTRLALREGLMPR